MPFWGYRLRRGREGRTAMRRSIPVQSLITWVAGLLLAVAIPLAGPAAGSLATIGHVSAPVADNPFGGGGSSGGGGASGSW
jgi:hypothetical protein